MTKLGFVAANLKHRPGRTLFAIGCFALTSLMCAATFTLVTKSSSLIGEFPRPRVVVLPSGESEITLAQVEALKRIPGVGDVEYQRNFQIAPTSGPQFTLWAASDGWISTHPNRVLSVQPETDRAWRQDRRGIIATHSLADPMHWLPGAAVSIPVEGGEVTGLFDGYIECPVPLAIGHFDQVTHGFKDPSLVSRLSVGCQLEQCTELIGAIDAHFANEPSGTFSMTQKEFFQSITEGTSSTLSQLFALVGLAIIAVTAIVTGSSLSIGFRDRMPEFATLRALGFQRTTIFGMLLAESASAALVGVTEHAC